MNMDFTCVLFTKAQYFIQPDEIVLLIVCF